MDEHSTQINTAATVIKSGGVVAYPTEACFGLGCAVGNKAGVKRVLALKNRSFEQGFVVVSDLLSRLKPYLDWDRLDAAQKDAIIASWPGPTNWLIPASVNCPNYLTGKHDTLAVRLSNFKPVSALCQASASPLISTSANLKGHPPLKTAQSVIDTFADTIDYIVDIPIQGLEYPCQIIDACSHKTIRQA